MMPKLTHEDFFEMLLKHSEGIMSFFEPVYDGEKIVDYSIKFLSNNFESLLGCNPEILISKSIKKVFDQFFDNGMLEIFNSCLSKEDFEILFERYFSFPEKQVWLESRAIHYAGGILLSCKDVTRLKVAEEKLKTIIKETEYKNAILNDSEVISQTASFRWNINQNDWYFSQNMQRLFNRFQITEKEYNNNGIFILFNNDEKAALQIQVDAFTYYDKLEPIRFKVIDDIYGNAYFLLSGSFYPSKDGPVLLGVLRDITTTVANQKLLQQNNLQLQKSNDDLAAFGHIVSHDLQEPLRKIQMFISRMDPDSDPDKNKAFLEKINNTSARMQKLIKSILHYSSLEFSNTVFKELKLKTVIDESIIDFDEQIEEVKAKISIGDLPNIYGIHDLLKQVFNNLLSNALKYASKEKQCQVNIESQDFKMDSLHINKAFVLSSDDYYKIKFSDNGVGFDQKNAAKAFKVFSRLHDRAQFGGTGIGLAICDKALKIHKGFIDVLSEPNEGTAFFLYFPKNKEI